MEFFGALKKAVTGVFDYKSVSTPRQFWFGVIWYYIFATVPTFAASYAQWGNSSTAAISGLAVVIVIMKLGAAAMILGLVARHFNYQGHNRLWILPFAVAQALGIATSIDTFMVFGGRDARVLFENLPYMLVAGAVSTGASILTLVLVLVKGKNFNPANASRPNAFSATSAASGSTNFCANCGAGAGDGFAFCATCGSPIG